MARTKKRKSKDIESDDVRDPSFSPETMRGVWAVLLLALTVVLTLAGFGWAGRVGNIIYSWLSFLFGVGYVLVPALCAVLSVSLFRSYEERLGILRAGASGVFFVAGLALIEILLPGHGGVAGSLLAQPLVYALDTVASVVMLFAIIVASLLVAFDTHPGFAFPTVAGWFTRTPQQDDEYEDDADVLAALPPEAPAPTQDEPEEEPSPAAPVAAAGDLAETQRDTVINDFSKRLTGLFTRGSTQAYKTPPLALLSKDKGKPGAGDAKASMVAIKRTLQNFGIDVEMDEVSIGPTVTRYALKPAEGVRLARIVSLQSNLELALAASPIRIEAPIPGKSLVGIEVPNTAKAMLGLGSILGEREFQENEKPLLAALGRDIAGMPHYANIAKMPHMLIAGATGAGKSVTIHDVVVSLLYRCGPEKLRLVMVDPKRVELTLYNGIPHLLAPVITDPKRAIMALKWLGKEMDRRYDILETEKVRDIESYHTNVLAPAEARASKSRATDSQDESTLPEQMPYIVAVIDELADLMQAFPRELEAAVVRLAQMSRAVGIHLILSTQRPSVQVITGLIKANVPARLALQVASQIDSRTILDMGGAEKLLGAGDMLFLSGDMSKPRRIQAPYVSETEVKKVVDYLKGAYEGELSDEVDFAGGSHGGTDDTIFSGTVQMDDGDTDPLYEDALAAVREAGKASTSYIQRKLRVGYARAARLMDMLEEQGVIGPADGAKPREVLGGSGDAHAAASESDELL
jgi:S-DNA-T family DNA segregation ATPase FtsK/SpoIIIE